MGDIIDLSKKKAEKKSEEQDQNKKEMPLDLEAVARKNEENRQRIERDRADANKKVLKTYRLNKKDKK